MSKKEKIAESIIIRVGGGIREVTREPAEVAEHQESVGLESDFEQTKDAQSYGVNLQSNAKIVSGKIIN